MQMCWGIEMPEQGGDQEFRPALPRALLSLHVEVVLGILPFRQLLAACPPQALAHCSYFLLPLSLLYPSLPPSLPQPLSSYLSPEQAGLSEQDICRPKTLWRGGWEEEVLGSNWAPSGGGTPSLGLAQPLPAPGTVGKEKILCGLKSTVPLGPDSGFIQLSGLSWEVRTGCSGFNHKREVGSSACW